MYKIVRFGAVALPSRMATDDLSTGQVENSLQRTLGGVYDLAAGERRRPQVRTLVHEGMYAAASAAALYSAVQPLRSMIGKKASLIRERHDGVEQWTEARLMGVDQPIAVADHFAHVANIRATFAIAGAVWRAMSTTSQAVAVGQGLTLATVANGGTEPVGDAILIITAATSITSIGLALGDAHFAFAATIQAGNSLVIDCGALSVTNDGVGAYDDLVLEADHAIGGWLELAPGSNDLEITANGAGTLDIIFYEQYI